MDVDRRADAITAQSLANQRPNGQVGHVMVIHHIEVDHVRTGLEDPIDLVTQPGEIR
ncbi:hypothetical protein D3C78_1920180 [compost metagenome]